MRPQRRGHQLRPQMPAARSIVLDRSAVSSEHSLLSRLIRQHPPLSMTQPFSIRGVKVLLPNDPGQYNDLFGLPLDTTQFQPWREVFEQVKAAGGNSVMFIVSNGTLANPRDSEFIDTIPLFPDPRWSRG